MNFIPSKHPNTRVRIYYLYDTTDKENIAQFDTLDDCQRQCRKLNKKFGMYKRYISKGSWYIVKSRN